MSSNSSTIHNTELHEVAILYLDDHEPDIRNFEMNVAKYNKVSQEESQKYNLPATRINLTSILKHFEAERTIESGSFNVFVCDHNMPNQKGFELIQYLKSGHENILYVLYTGIGPGLLLDDLKNRCDEAGVLVFKKQEDWSTLIELILNELQDVKYSMHATPRRSHLIDNMNSLYSKLANEIIQDTQNILALDPNYKIYIFGREFSAQEIVSALNKKDSIGFQFINAYIDGLKFFNKGSANE